MIVGDYNVEQVTAFVCNLTSEYGDSPTELQAESFARREKTIITPGSAIEILGVKEWEDVIKFYNKEIIGIGRRTRREKPCSNDPRQRRYTGEELLEELTKIYIEFDGKITQSKLAKRAKNQRTPSWSTLRKLGDPEDWERLVKEYLASRSLNHT